MLKPISIASGLLRDGAKIPERVAAEAVDHFFPGS